jgi:inhibitor of cysteine peptidase
MDTSRWHGPAIAAVLVAMMLVATGAVLFLEPARSPASGGILPVFSSYQQLDSYVGGSRNHNGGGLEFVSAQADATSGARHSTTNVQVEGVDEADMVKTDGTYLYIASGSQVTVVRSYPPSTLANVTVITSDQLLPSIFNLSFWISGIYLAGQQLVVVSSASSPYEPGPIPVTGFMPWRSLEERSVISVFDLSDINHPVLQAAFAISGSPTTSRLSGDVVYLVAQHYLWRDGSTLVLPQVWNGQSAVDISPSRIHYDPQSQDPSSFVNMLAVDLASLASNYTTIVAGYSTSAYMSTNALYLTFEKWTWIDAPATGVGTNNGVMTASQDSVRTSVYKITVDGLSMEAVARGEVPGVLLNQFSLDESNGRLRLATTAGWWTDSSAAVYILNDTMGTVGQLKGLASGERIYSARFVGDFLYLVTFRQVDPLFVISLVDPAHPAVMGELTVPGFSAYLHPIDPGHLLGIGMDNSSVKVSLFNVSDPVHPTLVNSCAIPDWSSSEALWDHKAVLYDQASGLLVLPITSYDNRAWNCTSKAFVFEISNDTGVGLIGAIENGAGQYISRAVYIGDYLYTVSETTVQVSLISDLTPVGSLIYAEPAPYYLPYLVGGGTVSMVEPMM